jgi:hypothetical protein
MRLFRLTALTLCGLLGVRAGAQQIPAVPPTPPAAAEAAPPVEPEPPARLSIVREQVLASFGNVQVENRPIVPSEGVGRVYKTSISKTGATSLRFHFEVTTPADGWIVQILRPTDGGDDVVVWTQSSDAGDSEFWSDEIAGSRARIEVLSFKPNTPLRLRLARTMMSGPVSSPFSITGNDDRKDLGSNQPSIQTWPKIQQAGKAVARLRFVGDDGRGYFCTGFLIANDLMLTNQHCIKSQREMRSAQVDFDYLATSSPLKPERLKEMLAADPGLDYALFRLQKPASVQPLRLKTSAVAKDQQLLIIGHPLGEPKQVSIEGCKVAGLDLEGSGSGKKTDFGHLCDTLGGNSGSPIFDGLVSGEVIGLHHLGFAQGIADPVNQGVGIALVWNDIRRRLPAVAAEIQ